MIRTPPVVLTCRGWACGCWPTPACSVRVEHTFDMGYGDDWLR